MSERKYGTFSERAASVSTENLTATSRLQRAPSLPRSYSRTRSGIPVAAAVQRPEPVTNCTATAVLGTVPPRGSVLSPIPFVLLVFCTAFSVVSVLLLSYILYRIFSSNHYFDHTNNCHRHFFNHLFHICSGLPQHFRIGHGGRAARQSTFSVLTVCTTKGLVRYSIVA